MSIPGAASPLFLATTAGAAGDFEISRSLRFNSADSANLSRTPSSASNRRTWTWSGWVKRSQLGVTQGRLFGGGTSDYFDLYFPSGDELRVLWTGNSLTTTTAVFRDPSAWYHIVLAVDTTQSTANDRIKLYVNGALQDRASTNPSQNYDTAVNNNVEHHIGRYAGSGGSSYFNGYLAEVNFIDGSALDPTSFGAFDSGVWRPKDTDGLTFGTNGFRLQFADNSSNAALGTDSSGNSNTWSVNNLTTAAALNPTAQQNFNVVTWTGNSSSRDIATTLAPDFVWIKSRSHTTNHVVYDVVRGPSKVLYVDAAADEGSSSSQLTAFNSNSFSLGSGNEVNQSGRTYVAWYWRAGGAASSNTDGSITTSVSANAAYGFSVVSWTGVNNASAKTIGHGLGAVPKWVIVKNRTDDVAWAVYHESIGNTKYLNLDSDSAAATSSAYWNNTSPTSSVITLYNSAEVQSINKNYVAYVWSEVAGFSKFSSYVGDGSSTKKITTGFKPRFLLVKPSSSTGNWNIFDSERPPNTATVTYSLQPNLINAEYQSEPGITFLDDGFTLNSVNTNGTTYIYAAFAATTGDAVGIDSLVDTPTNAAEPSDSGIGGEVVGNYCTWNPLNKPSAITLSNGNLDCQLGSSDAVQLSTIGMSSGKWYAEITGISTTGGFYNAIGLGKEGAGGYLGSNAQGWGYHQDGRKIAGGGAASYGASYAQGDVIGVAFDADNGTLTFYKNGSSQGTAYTGLTSGPYFFAVGSSQTKNVANFGQRAFAYQNAGTNRPSADYKALNTANLPTPTIADGSDYFQTKIFTGNGSSTVLTTGFSPDMIWLKSRASAFSHYLGDIVRGSNKLVRPSSTAAEITTTTGISSFNSDGVTLGSGSETNANNDSMVAWIWDAGTSTVTNNDGNIASSVRANPSAGFSIVSYTGTGTGSDTVGHGLNAAPKIIILKDRDNAEDWPVYHTLVDGSYDFLYLNLTASNSNSGWNVPTNSVFSASGAAGSGNKMIAYCFAPVAGYSAMGSFVSNNSTDGNFIYLGFKPSWIMVKRTDSTSNWFILDTARDTYNVMDAVLDANLSDAERHADIWDSLSNGMKLRIALPGTFIYYAVAENSFQANGGLAR